MELVIALVVVALLFLVFREVQKRINSYSFKLHDDPPPGVDAENLGDNPKPTRNSRPKQKDT